MQDGTLFGLPVVLDTRDPEIVPGDKVLLQYQGQDLATVDISSKWEPNKPLEAQQCYGTTSIEHPAVAMITGERGKYYLGATMHACMPGWPDSMHNLPRWGDASPLPRAWCWAWSHHHLKACTHKPANSRPAPGSSTPHCCTSTPAPQLQAARLQAASPDSPQPALAWPSAACPAAPHSRVVSEHSGSPPARRAGGKVKGLALPKRVFPCASPAEVRESLPEGKDVLAFQCRNPIHKAHYELFIRALEAQNVGEGAVCLVHPTCGPTQVRAAPGPRVKGLGSRL